QMIRVCDNLMSNAITHTPVHGEIKLLAVGTKSIPYNWLFDYVMSQYTFDAENNAYLIVQNEGEGIDEEAQQQLFQPLYQMDQARNKQERKQGTGLGLSITQQIVEQHDGDVTVLSNEILGACVICRIPKRREQDDHLSYIIFYFYLNLYCFNDWLLQASIQSGKCHNKSIRYR